MSHAQYTQRHSPDASLPGWACLKCVRQQRRHPPALNDIPPRTKQGHFLLTVFFARIMNLQSDLQNSHFEIFTSYLLWRNTTAIKKLLKKIFLQSSYYLVFDNQEKPEGRVHFKQNELFWEVYPGDPFNPSPSDPFYPNQLSTHHSTKQRVRF